MRIASQPSKVLEHLRLYGSITSMEAFSKYHITRLAAVIYRLRAAGYNIVTYDMDNDDVRYAKYVLKEKEV